MCPLKKIRKATQILLKIRPDLEPLKEGKVAFTCKKLELEFPNPSIIHQV